MAEPTVAITIRVRPALAGLARLLADHLKITQAELLERAIHALERELASTAQPEYDPDEGEEPQS